MNPDNYLYLSALLFTIGAAGVLLRRNAIWTAKWWRSSPWSSPRVRWWSASRSS
jgi:hypothetical protein